MNLTRRPGWPLAAALLALLAGCGDAVAPAGTPSTVSVHAYVDADGSGGISEGDVFIPGVVVRLMPLSAGDNPGVAAMEATTGADGVARFEGVMPGPWVVTASGATPEGAVLATASAPIISAPYQGAELATEFRYVFNPGEISGRLFRDNNDNNQYDPGIDTPAPGIPVALYAGATASGEPVATTTTDAAGAFRFPVLRPGQYTWQVTPLPTMTIVGGATQAVTVEALQTAQVGVRFTGNLIVPIAQARASAGSPVAVEGVVTAGVGVFSTNANSNQFNVQDATGGVLVLQVPLASGIATGDSVRVVGNATVSGGELVITGNPTVTVLAAARPLPAARVITAQQAAQSTAADPLQGLLVTVPNVRVDSVGGGSFGYDVFVTGADGGAFRVRVSLQSIAPQAFWEVGRSYDITGTLAMFSNNAQVKLRSADDIVARSTAATIGSVRTAAFADSAGTFHSTVTIEGVVTVAQGTLRTDNAYIQDATGGMLIFRVPVGFGLELGDSIRVTGRLNWFNQELQLEGASAAAPLQIERLGTAAPRAPRTLSGSQIASRLYEGQLVRAPNVEVISIGTPTAAGGFDVNVRAADGTQFVIRMENSSIGLPPASWSVGGVYTVVGALGTFRGSAQIKPRGAADVTAGVANVMSIAAAKQAPLNDTITVEGIVIAPVGPFGTSHAYIYDGTGGILIFGVPVNDITLEIGDVVRVTGLAGAFSGERQVARFSASSLLQVTRTGTSPAPAPRVVSGADVAARTYEGELVLLSGAEVLAVGAVAAAGGYNVTMRAQDGTEVTVRHDRAAVGVPVETFVVGGIYDVVAIPSAFNNAPQLKVRGPGDVVRR